ncbi:UDP-N-acetylglucosamine 4,6-dehydratase (inverting) [Curvivirga sp.]|uniref:UDP-N-acetylglucosamine 4,6-dehydratase (inverting) n=1 Tax=Curvivirga sp. TaxID=2856848 RepID=UPI003B59084A
MSLLRDFDECSIDLNGKDILLTGGTGSFGKKFVETVVNRYEPNRLIIFSRDEAKQHEMQTRFGLEKYPFMRYFIGDVRDYERLVMAMRGVDYVVHAAALKHVTVAEYNPFECIKTNVIGAENIVNASLQTGVKKVLALSTDKAANPVNLYGASKLASDKIFIAANNLSGSKGTSFSVVRYGNVIGSRGSIIPVFKKIIAGGTSSLPITDDRMTRFVITLQQGVDFVLSCMSSMNGCEVFVPKIPSVNIVDIAEAMAPGIDTHIIGIRPGEKLHETLISIDDARTTVEMDDRYIIFPAHDFRSNSAFEGDGMGDEFTYVSDLNVEWLNADEIRDLLTQVPIEVV